MLNRTQALVLGFFAFAWIGLIVILAVDPDVYDQSLKLPTRGRSIGEAAFVILLTAFIALLSCGVLRRWRWTFWLILIASLAGALRIPSSILELSGTISTAEPGWYVLSQGVIGVAQLGIGLTMAAEYRRAGVWGAAETAPHTR